MPYRYEQQGTSVKRVLWRANAAVRAALATVAPFWFSPSVSTMLLAGAKARLSYREIVARGRATTRHLMLSTALVLSVLVLLNLGIVAA